MHQSGIGATRKDWREWRGSREPPRAPRRTPEDRWIQTENRQQSYSASPPRPRPLTPLFLLTTTQLTHLGSHPKLLSSAGIYRQGRSADQVADLWDGLVGPFFSAMRVGTSCFLSIRDTETHTNDSGCTVAPNLGDSSETAHPNQARPVEENLAFSRERREGEKKGTSLAASLYTTR